MVMTRKTRKLNLSTPQGKWLLAGCSSVALSALVAVTLTTRIVHADAPLSQSVTISGAPLRQTPSSKAFAVTAAKVAAQENAKEAARSEQAAIKRGDRLHGIASWYGGVFEGRKTASGERYDMYAMTACHPTLPFGSLVKVVNLKNKRSVVVRKIGRASCR